MRDTSSMFLTLVYPVTVVSAIAIAIALVCNTIQSILKLINFSLDDLFPNFKKWGPSGLSCDSIHGPHSKLSTAILGTFRSGLKGQIA